MERSVLSNGTYQMKILTLVLMVLLVGCGGGGGGSTPAAKEYGTPVTSDELFTDVQTYLSVLPDPRMKSYYSEIHRMQQIATVYDGPDTFQVSAYQRAELEEWGLSVGEAYYTPCPDYDYYNASKSKQCRSVDRYEDGFYKWRSAAPSTFRHDHMKQELRAVAGVSYMVKMVLLNDPTNERALVLRDLIYTETYLKWQHDIATEVVPHYVAWAEYMIEMFEDTNYEQDYASRRDWLLDHFWVDNGRAGLYSTHPNELPRKHIWNGYDFSPANASDLSHADTTVFLLRHDIDTVALANTMRTEAFNGSKYDPFTNGYCLQDGRNLEVFCRIYGDEESGGWYPSRKLFGFTSLPMLDELLIAYNDDHTGAKNTYVIMLYKELHGEETKPQVRSKT